MAFFAIYGVITLFFKKSNLNIFRHNMFIQAFCIAALIALALEATYFNYPYYLKFYAGEELHTLKVSPQDSSIILTSDGTLAEMIYEDKYDSTKVMAGIAFKNLNRRVTSIFVEPVFGTADFMQVDVVVIDEVATRRISRFLLNGLPNTNQLSIQSSGKASELQFFMSGTISKITINEQIPLYFSGLRLFAFSCVFFAIILFFNKNLRAKIAYLLFEYKFDSANKKQRLIYTFSAILLIIFSFICTFTTTKFFQEHPPYHQYNKYLVDALMQGRVHLEWGNPEKLLDVENPYCTFRLYDSKDYELGVDWAYDWAWYKGKFYSYFGVVPAVILYVPYKMITGNYLSNHAGIFIFIAISIILMAMLWRHCVMKYMPNASFIFYLLSFFTLFFASGLFSPLRFTQFYSIVAAGGFMFVMAGMLLLFKSVEREQPNLVQVSLACLCFALAVGCRPNLVFVSILVPVVLWKYRSFKLAMFILAPYIMIAIPLCFYNYIRFGSITDFGANYNMSNFNPLAFKNILSPIEKTINTFICSVSYLFSINNYSISFPYVTSMPQDSKFIGHIVRFHDRGCGMINFPIVLCLFYFFKNITARNKPKAFPIQSACLIVAAVLILLNSWLIGHSGRYMMDFAIFIIFVSLFCAYYWCNDQMCDYLNKVRLKIVYVMLAVSTFVGLFLFATTVTNDATPTNHALFRYLQYSLGLFGVM